MRRLDKKSTHDANGSRHLRVLVIEDHQDVAANIGDYLEEKGHVVDFSMDGITGLHLAVTQTFDAIVLARQAKLGASCRVQVPVG